MGSSPGNITTKNCGENNYGPENQIRTSTIFPHDNIYPDENKPPKSNHYGFPQYMAGPHGIDGNYPLSVTTESGELPLPFFGGNFGVILHDFFRPNYHKNQSNCKPFFLTIVNYPIFSLDYHIYVFRKNIKIFSFPKKYPNNLSKMGNILQFLG